MTEPPRRISPTRRLRRTGEAAVVLVALGVLGGSVFIWSGYYNVAASEPHLGVTNWLLAEVRDQSIAARADNIIVPDLSDPGLSHLGAEHYLGACVSCHGLPGEPTNPVNEQMLPRPPDLTHANADYSAAELYVIIRYGLKYAGMPAWPAVEREDEVWSVVATLVRLHEQGPESFARLALGPDADVPGNTLAVPEDYESPALNQCARCHGDAGAAPIDEAVPALAGQSAEYLYRSLQEYAAEVRPSGIMQPVGHVLEPEEMVALSDYYAGLQPVALEPVGDAAAVARGREIALNGIPDEAVPACAACHDGTAAQQFGRLDHLSAAYIGMQLGVWRDGLRDQTGYGIIMAQIAKDLTPEQIGDLGAYYQSLAGTSVARAARP